MQLREGMSFIKLKIDYAGLTTAVCVLLPKRAYLLRRSWKLSLDGKSNRGGKLWTTELLFNYKWCMRLSLMPEKRISIKKQRLKKKFCRLAFKWLQFGLRIINFFVTWFSHLKTIRTKLRWLKRPLLPKWLITFMMTQEGLVRLWSKWKIKHLSPGWVSGALSRDSRGALIKNTHLASSSGPSEWESLGWSWGLCSLTTFSKSLVRSKCGINEH